MTPGPGGCDPTPEQGRAVRCARGPVLLGRRTLIAGIVNTTPDSFHAASRTPGRDAAVARGLALWQEGADLLDVGGESARPGAEAVPVQVELARVVPVVEALAARCRVPLSVDTTHAEVAAAALDAGAWWVNDVSALSDPAMAGVVATRGAAVVLMHRRGTPRDMQLDTVYDDLLGDVLRLLGERAAVARAAGIDPASILVDPGIGFGKSARDNLLLLAGIPRLMELGYPVYIGASRKSFLGNLFGWPVQDRLGGSLGAAAAAITRGAAVVRVHDVRETRQLAEVLAAVPPWDGPVGGTMVWDPA